MNIKKLLLVAIVALILSGCAVEGSVVSSGFGGLFTKTDEPSCGEVMRTYGHGTPLGAARIGSDTWLKRRVLYSSNVGGAVRYALAYGEADGEWQAGRLYQPKLQQKNFILEHGLWKTVVDSHGYEYKVNFDVRMYEDEVNTSVRHNRRKMYVYLKVLGEKLGARGIERTIPLVGLKNRKDPPSGWIMCPYY